MSEMNAKGKQFQTLDSSPARKNERRKIEANKRKKYRKQ